MKHEEFIQKVREIVAANLPDGSDAKAKILRCKLVYGIGDGSYRGICYYSSWKNGHEHPVETCEVAATGEESPIQLAGTCIHELGHVLAGPGAGHGSEWKKACAYLGLRCILAAGTRYSLAHLAPAIRSQIAALCTLSDGTPVFGTRGMGVPFVGLPVNLRPCPLGTGTRGGRSRGTGSGSRLRKYACTCETHDGKPGPFNFNAASDTISATCNVCGSAFKRVERTRRGAQPPDPNNRCLVHKVGTDGVCTVCGNQVVRKGKAA